MVFPWADRNRLLGCFSARCFSLTGLAVGGSSVAALGISPDTFPERVHQADNIAGPLFRLRCLDGMPLGFALNQLSQRLIILVVESQSVN